MDKTPWNIAIFDRYMQNTLFKCRLKYVWTIFKPTGLIMLPLPHFMITKIAMNLRHHYQFLAYMTLKWTKKLENFHKLIANSIGHEIKISTFG